MLYHQRDLDAGKNHRFSFDNTNYENDGHSEYSRTDQRVMGSHDYIVKRPHNMRIRTWPRKNSENEEQSGNKYVSEFQWLADGEKEDDDDPSVPSSKMVKVIFPVDRTKEEETYPEFHHSHRHDNIFYPSTRSETIAKYQKEMMELVRDVPESGYELSLRDIVELPKTVKAMNEDVIKEDQQETEKEEPVKVKKPLFRNETFSHSPVMLNFFLSINYGKSNRSGIIGSKVCPKPPNEKSRVEKSMSGKSRNNNHNRSGEIESKANSSSSHKNKKMTGCFPFIPTITWSRHKVQRRSHTLT